jgi:hypothetical protein
VSKLDRAAVSATLPKESQAEARPDSRGADYLLTLPRGVIDRLKAMRVPGETHRRHQRVAKGHVKLAEPFLIMAALFAAPIIAKEISRGRTITD